VDNVVVLALVERMLFLPAVSINLLRMSGSSTYLFNDKVKVLTTSLNLIANAVELDLGTLLQARLDRDLEKLVRLYALARLVESLALDLHLLGDAVVEFFKRKRQRALDRRDLGGGIAASTFGSAKGRPHASATGSRSAARSTTKSRENVGIVVIASNAATVLAHKLGKDVLGVVEVEAGRSAAEVEGPSTASPAGHSLETAKATGHAAVAAVAGASEGIAALGTRGRGGAAAEEELEAILVVDLALLRVGQDFVSLGALLEFLGSAGVVLVLVGVPLQSRFPVCHVRWLASRDSEDKAEGQAR
jgi:hypothetical protein